MINGQLVHVFLNVHNKDVSFPFYKKFLGLLGYKIEFEDNDQLGLNNRSNEIWLRALPNTSRRVNRQDTGLNHIAFRVGSKQDVDWFVTQFIDLLEIDTLYNSPRIFPDFTDDYYAVYFEDPQGIKLEVTSYTFDLNHLD